MRALIRRSADIVRVMKRESGLERAAASSQTNFATWRRSTQSLDHGASHGLLTIFFDSEESLDSMVAARPLAAADLFHSEALCPGFLQ